MSKQNLFDEVAAKSKRASRDEDKAVINKKSGGSVVTKGDGSTHMTSGIYAQYKTDKNSGVATEISLISNTITVQKEIMANDITINRHKLNSQLYEFTNFKNNHGTVMGNLMMDATILVKAWEPTLQEFVLIRRPARFPIFGNLLDAYVVDERLDVYVDASDDFASYTANLNDLQEIQKQPIEEESEEAPSDSDKDTATDTVPSNPNTEDVTVDENYTVEITGDPDSGNYEKKETYTNTTTSTTGDPSSGNYSTSTSTTNKVTTTGRKETNK